MIRMLDILGAEKRLIVYEMVLYYNCRQGKITDWRETNMVNYYQFHS
jgi:hypothetical protein